MTEWTTKDIIQWQEDTFPDATLEAQIEKFADERSEYIKGRRDMIELADMYIVACSIARWDMVQAARAFAEVHRQLQAHDHRQHFQEFVRKKMNINKTRNWQKIGGKYQHTEDNNGER